MKWSLVILFQFLFFYAPAQKAVPGSVYDFKVTAFSGSDIDFAAFKGKKILIVNMPRLSEHDPQYAELNALYQKYKDKLVVVGFLADDFGVAPGSKQGASAYHTDDYKVSFPLAAKVPVRGDNRAPVYHWLTEKKYNNLKDSEVKWDFQKYLVDGSGALVAVFDPKIRATNPALIAAIEK